MILKNKLTKETLDIPYSEFRIKFAKEIQDAFESSRKTQLNKYSWNFKDDNSLEFNFYFELHWNFNHFLVLEGFRGKHVYLNDPALGRRKITFQELDDCFTGVVLTFALTEQFTKEGKKTNIVGYILNRVSEQKAVLFELFYIGVLLVFPGLVLPVLSQVFIDDVLGKGFQNG